MVTPSRSAAGCAGLPPPPSGKLVELQVRFPNGMADVQDDPHGRRRSLVARAIGSAARAAGALSLPRAAATRGRLSVRHRRLSLRERSRARAPMKRRRCATSAMRQSCEHRPQVKEAACSRSCAQHLTYANVTATLALFIALGGSSYAALRVGSREIADNSIRSRDVRNHSLTRHDLAKQHAGWQRDSRITSRARPACRCGRQRQPSRRRYSRGSEDQVSGRHAAHRRCLCGEAADAPPWRMAPRSDQCSRVRQSPRTRAPAADPRRAAGCPSGSRTSSGR